MYGGLRRRRAPRRSRAALPACPPQPPMRRLLPLAFVPPAGAGEPPRSHSAWRPARRSWRVLRRGPGVTGGTRLAALFRPPVPPPVAAAAAALTRRQPRSSQGRKNKCTNQKTGAGKVHRFTRNILCTLPLPPPQFMVELLKRRFVISPPKCPLLGRDTTPRATLKGGPFLYLILIWGKIRIATCSFCGFGSLEQWGNAGKIRIFAKKKNKTPCKQKSKMLF